MVYLFFDLFYDYSVFEFYIDVCIMEIYYFKYYVVYILKVNVVIEGSDLEFKLIEEFIFDLSVVLEGICGVV